MPTHRAPHPTVGPHPPSARDGVGASRVYLPPGPWSRVLDFLVQRFVHVPAAVWCQRLREGRVFNGQGQALSAQSAYAPGTWVYYYREVQDELVIPFEVDILYQDDHLVVVDKPHFLPVTPSGGQLAHTLLVRVRRALGRDTLVPVHRLDRETAGLVLLAGSPAARSAYGGLFRTHAIEKTYQAVSIHRPDLPLPLTRRSRIAPASHFMLQHEVPGPVNAITHIERSAVHGDLARYTLKPVTGQRHQLRIHMAALGLPLLNDTLYPVLQPQATPDWDHPLQLLASELRWRDPFSGQPRHFVSRRRLII
ncbi:MAG: RluA family pseudouridine synthase [Rhodoferax sp.]